MLSEERLTCPKCKEEEVAYLCSGCGNCPKCCDCSVDTDPSHTHAG